MQVQLKPLVSVSVVVASATATSPAARRSVGRRRGSLRVGTKPQAGVLRSARSLAFRAVPPKELSPSQLIDGRIKESATGGATSSAGSALIKEADPDVVEEWKWRGVPTWYHDGIICTGETYKSIVKMTFANGAALKDPSGLFNSSLEGNTRRAIDFHEGEKINEKALKALIRAAVTLNESKAKK